MMTLTNDTIKMVATLGSAAKRRRHGLFIVEGAKAVTEMASGFEAELVAATAEWIDANEPIAKRLGAVQATARQLERMTQLTTAPDVLAVMRLPQVETPQLDPDALLLALDTIQDPGNLGTIIRTADWMGVSTILASHGTVDCFSPKVVQATMGSLTRVKVVYCNLASTLEELKAAGRPVLGTMLKGDDIFATPIASNAVIVIGNEGRGISEEVARTLTRRITIPAFAPERPHPESLNAATATAVALTAARFMPGQLAKS